MDRHLGSRRVIGGVGGVLTAAATLLVLTSGSASSASRCDYVKGSVEEFEITVPGKELAAEGPVKGDLKGTYHFELRSLSDPVDASGPASSVVTFVGDSSITSKDGSSVLTFTEAGGFDTNSNPGNFADLLTITGGTGHWAGASGHMHLNGFYSLSAGYGMSFYAGVVCLQ